MKKLIQLCKDLVSQLDAGMSFQIILFIIGKEPS